MDNGAEGHLQSTLPSESVFAQHADVFGHLTDLWCGVSSFGGGLGRDGAGCGNVRAPKSRPFSARSY